MFLSISPKRLPSRPKLQRRHTHYEKEDEANFRSFKTEVDKANKPKETLIHNISTMGQCISSTQQLPLYLQIPRDLASSVHFVSQGYSGTYCQSLLFEKRIS